MNQSKLLLLLLVGHMGTAAAVGPGDLGNLSGQTVGISNTYSVSTLLPVGSAFSDVYQFDINPESEAVGTSVTLNLDLPYFLGPEFELSNMKLEFVSAGGTTIVSDSQSSHPGTTLSLSALLPAANAYKFIVSGNVTGIFGGSYGGVLQAFPNSSIMSLPIPEANVYALMALGIGLVGFLARRSKA